MDTVANKKIPTSAKNLAPAAKSAVNINETTNFPGLSLWSSASAVPLTMEQVPTAGILVPIDKIYCRSSGTY
jgi:hypothetical protein